MKNNKNLTKEEKIKIARRNYFKCYREKNRSRIKEIKENFWLRRYEELQNKS